MLHKDLLSRLCKARNMLRDPENGVRSISEIARWSGISSFHFIRLFRAVFGQTPHQCRISCRLELARHLLIVTDRSVTEICFEVGFTSLGTFSSVFTQRVGLSPSSYRKRMREMQKRREEIPQELIPGCFTLMGSPERKIRNFQEAS
jgi:AraC-like DNA-binding protein